MQQLKYGLIGFPLTHSFSKAWFDSKFHGEKLSHCSYSNYELAKISELPALLTDEYLQGLNVTIPYKKQIIPYLDFIDQTALEAGAVNCINRIGNEWKGYNTDIIGFENSLKPMLRSHHTKAMVLGTGGAAQAIFYVLNKLGIPFIKVSRNEQVDTMNYYDLNEGLINEHKIIINTTPVGTFPDIDQAPSIPYNGITTEHLCFDLIYNPEETLFLSQCRNNGAQIKNGYEMLVIQAEESWKRWETSGQ